MNLTLTYRDNNFSWLINKNPSNEYNQKLNKKFNIHGKFINDSTYFVKVLPNHDYFVKYARQENLDKYLIKEKYIVSPLNLIVMDKIFRDAMRGKFNIVHDYHSKKEFSLSISPIIVHDEHLLKNLFQTYLDDCNIVIIEMNDFDNINSDIKVCYLSISGTESLTLILQKIFILLFVYTIKLVNKSFKPNHDQLKKLLLLTNDWLDKDSEYYNLISSRLGGNRYGKHFFQNDGKIEVPKDTLFTPASDKRYEAIINAIPDNSSILELGCNAGRVPFFIKKFKKQINKYTGLDSNGRAIQRAIDRNKLRKCRFYQSNIMYMDKYYFEQHDVILLTEVIEHFDSQDRQSIIKFLSDNCKGKTIIITVPNVEVNEAYWGLTGEYRHYDHKTEYTYNQLKAEIIDIFEAKNFKVNKICISDDMFYFKDQISFMLVIN
jgi:SAM-dependent methyltransferase